MLKQGDVVKCVWGTHRGKEGAITEVKEISLMVKQSNGSTFETVEDYLELTKGDEGGRK